MHSLELVRGAAVQNSILVGLAFSIFDRELRRRISLWQAASELTVSSTASRSRQTRGTIATVAERESVQCHRHRHLGLAVSHRSSSGSFYVGPLRRCHRALATKSLVSLRYLWCWSGGPTVGSSIRQLATETRPSADAATSRGTALASSWWKCFESEIRHRARAPAATALNANNKGDSRNGSPSEALVGSMARLTLVRPPANPKSHGGSHN